MTQYLPIKAWCYINNSNELQIFMCPRATNSISPQDCFIYEFNRMCLNIFVAISLISHKKIKRYAEEKKGWKSLSTALSAHCMPMVSREFTLTFSIYGFSLASYLASSFLHRWGWKVADSKHNIQVYLSFYFYTEQHRCLRKFFKKRLFLCQAVWRMPHAFLALTVR